MPSATSLQEHIVRLLAESERPVLNRVLLALLPRQLEREVPSKEYFAAIDDLADRQIVGKARGQGGKVYLSRAVPESSALQSTSYWTEQRLMPCLHAFLETAFWRQLELPTDGQWIVINTSMIGPRDGKWAHPDFTIVSVMPFQVLPRPQLDVYSFELKAEFAADITSVHEALAQTRMTNFGYLVWHLPDRSLREVRLTEIGAHCTAHGIGLIVARDPPDPTSWRIDRVAERKDTPLSEIDGFLASSRLTNEHRQLLRCKLSEH